MKKSLILLFFLLLLGCTNSIDAEKAFSSQKEVWCYIKDGVCKKINESLCADIGDSVEADDERCNSSSSDEEISSSSEDGDDGSSSSIVINSSSSRAAGSSSSRAVSSSSAGSGSSSSRAVSSSSDEEISSSSEDEDGSSSSIGTLSSSSSTVGSSSSVSSSSSVAVSSSSSLVAPSLGACSATFPSYVSKAKKEYLGDLISVVNDHERCGNVVYTLAGGGNPNNMPSISGDSINFANYPSSSATRTLNITANVTCPGFTIPAKTCSVSIEVVADKFAKIETCDNPRVPVGPGATVVEITCLKEDGSPAKEFGCDKPSGSNDFGPNNVFTLNKVKAGPNTTNWQSGWASVAIPAAIAAKESKRVLIEYNGGQMGCVAF